MKTRHCPICDYRLAQQRLDDSQAIELMMDHIEKSHNIIEAVAVLLVRFS